jgi:hypothetical protein
MIFSTCVLVREYNIRAGRCQDLISPRKAYTSFYVERASADEDKLLDIYLVVSAVVRTQVMFIFWLLIDETPDSSICACDVMVGGPEIGS